MVGILSLVHCWQVFSIDVMSAIDTKIDEKMLWDLFKNHNDDSAREQLIRFYTSLSKKIAASIYSMRIDDEVEFNDYLHYGYIGLIESVDRFDPSRNIMFNTFATYRINGAILNGISKLTEKREQISTQSRLRNERAKSITNNQSDSKQDLFGYFADSTIALALSFMLEDTFLIQFEEKESDSTPYSVSVLEQLKLDLSNAIEILNESEQYIIRSHYNKYISFNVIATHLGITKGRVSQLHKRALNKLRDQLNDNLLDSEY